MSGVTLKPGTARRVLRALERDDMRAFGANAASRESRDDQELQLVTITSTTLTSGMYPGLRWDLDGETNVKTAAVPPDVIKVDTPNGELLATGVYYWAKLVGVDQDDRQSIYQVVGRVIQFSGARVSNAAAHTIAVGVTWDVEWPVADYDTDDYRLSVALDPTGIYFKAPATGMYLVTANAIIQAAAGPGRIEFSIRSTSSADCIASQNYSGADDYCFSISTVLQMSLDDLVRVRTYNPNRGSGADVLFEGNASAFTITRLG